MRSLSQTQTLKRPVLSARAFLFLIACSLACTACAQKPVNPWRGSNSVPKLQCGNHPCRQVPGVPSIDIPPVPPDNTVFGLDGLPIGFSN